MTVSDLHRAGASSRRSALSPAPTAAVLAAAGFALCVGLRIGGPRVTDYVDDLGTFAAAAAATVACVIAALRSDPRLRRFWAVLAAALAAWTFGEGVWAVYDLVLARQAPVPSLADVGYLGGVPLVAAALLSHPGQHGSIRERARRPLDGAIAATALLFLSWTFVLGPVWHSSDLSAAAGVVSVAYPFGDVVVVWLLLSTLRNLAGRVPSALWAVLFGLLSMTLCDSLYTYFTVTRGYTTGNIIDVGWLVGYLAIALGACWYRSETIAERRPQVARVTAISAAAPYLPTFLALALIAVRTQLGSGVDSTSLLIAFGLTGLVLTREALVLLPSRPHPVAVAGKGGPR
ncbi:MAG TPA: hypothetical protein VG650_03845 [Mycobacteriales bacterium]|nr:hypothetical protein [Mycobacteriales bacterium]